MHASSAAASRPRCSAALTDSHRPSDSLRLAATAPLARACIASRWRRTKTWRRFSTRSCSCIQTRSVYGICHGRRSLVPRPACRWWLIRRVAGGSSGVSLVAHPAYCTPTLQDNKKEIASEAEQPTGYELLSFHNGQPQIGGQTPDKYRDAASTQLATTGTMRRAYSEEQLPTVEYTKIDELKTQALHSAMSQHKRGDASFTARMTADSDDEFGFGFGPGEDGLAQTKSSSSLDSAMASHSNSLNGSVRSGASHSSDGLRQKRKQLRRYVNVSNSQLSVMLNQERRSNGAVTSTIMGKQWGVAWTGGKGGGAATRGDARRPPCTLVCRHHSPSSVRGSPFFSPSRWSLSLNQYCLDPFSTARRGRGGGGERLGQRC